MRFWCRFNLIKINLWWLQRNMINGGCIHLPQGNRPEIQNPNLVQCAVQSMGSVDILQSLNL